MLKLSEIARDSILPDILPFLSINSEVVEDKHVIVVHVSAGVNRPYYGEFYKLNLVNPFDL